LRKKKELQEKISETNRARRIVVAGLIAGLTLTVLGLMLFTLLFIIGFTVFIICTGIASFLTALKWGYSKALKIEIEDKTVSLPTRLCPRCGTEVRKKVKYCPKCGKEIQTKKH
jgi:ribosomal protein S27AE